MNEFQDIALQTNKPRTLLHYRVDRDRVDNTFNNASSKIHTPRFAAEITRDVREVFLFFATDF